MLGAALWGTTGTAQALAPEAATPLSIGTLRLLVGGVGLVLWVRGRGNFGDPLRWPRLPVIAGIMGVAAYQLSFFAAVDRTGVAVGTIVGIGSAPVLAGVLGKAIRDEPLSRRWYAATIIAIIVCVLLTFSGARTGADVGVDPLGIVLAVGAGGTYAVYALASKVLIDTHPPDAVMAVIFAGGALLLAPLLLTQPTGWTLTPAGGLVALHLGLVTVTLAYILFGRGLRGVPSSTAVTLSLAEPLTAGVLGVVVLGERLTPAAIAGIVLLFLSLWWLSRKQT